MKKPYHHTLKDFLAIVDPEKKQHPNSAYNDNNYRDISREDMDAKYPKLVKSFSRAGLDFEIREMAIDRYEKDIIELDDEGIPARDENNELIYLTMEQKIERVKPRYFYEHTVYDATNNRQVAWTEEDWGCLLVITSDQYRGLNLGIDMLCEHYKMEPERETGGFTPSGGLAFRKMHQQLVVEHMNSDGYEKDIESGLLTQEYVNEIIKSAHATKEIRDELVSELKNIGALEDYYYLEVTFPYKEKPDMPSWNINNPNDWLLHVDSNWAVMYDKKIFDYLDHNDKKSFEHLCEQSIIGYSYIGGTYNASQTPKLFRLYGKNEKIKAFMAEVAFNGYEGEKVRVFKEDLPLIEKYLDKKLELTPMKGHLLTEAVMPEKTMHNLKEMKFREKFIRKDNDQFDEKWTLIQELASQLVESEYRKKHEKENEDDFTY